MARFWALSLLMAFLIIIDQLTKGAVQSSLALGEISPVIDGFFSFTHVHNYGAAFGFGAESNPILRQIFFLYVPVLFCGWVFYALIKSLKGTIYVPLAYALILAGAIGNLLDRFSLGYVVDFFLFFWKSEDHHFPAFNIADAAISIAAALLIFDVLKRWRDKNVAHSLPKL
jgi:signal peptidase II